MAEPRTISVYVSLNEATECMSVSVKTIRRWIAAGTLPAYRCGKRAIRIKLEDLEAAPRPIPSSAVVRSGTLPNSVAMPGFALKSSTRRISQIPLSESNLGPA